MVESVQLSNTPLSCNPLMFRRQKTIPRTSLPMLMSVQQPSLIPLSQSPNVLAQIVAKQSLSSMKANAVMQRVYSSSQTRSINAASLLPTSRVPSPFADLVRRPSWGSRGARASFARTALDVGDRRERGADRSGSIVVSRSGYSSSYPKVVQGQPAQDRKAPRVSPSLLPSFPSPTRSGSPFSVQKALVD